jgi:hypothetical protein
VTDIATTRTQYATWQSNACLDQLEKDLTAVHEGLAAHTLTRAQAAVWLQLLIESAADELVRLQNFTRGTS